MLNARKATPIGRRFDQFVELTNNIASIWIFAIMILIVADVLSRSFMNAAINGVSELVQISIVAILYMQVPNALKDGSLARSDGLFNFMVRNYPPIGHAMGVVFHMMGVLLGFLIVSGGWPKWLQAYHGGHFVGVEGVFTFPEWPHRLIVCIGCAILSLQFLRMAWSHLVMLINPALRNVTENKGDAQ